MVGKTKDGQNCILHAAKRAAIVAALFLAGCSVTAQEVADFFTDPAWKDLRPGVVQWPGVGRKWEQSTTTYTTSEGQTVSIPVTQESEEESDTDLGG